MKTIIKSLALAFSLGIVTTASSFADTNPGGRTTTVASYKTGIYSNQAGKLNIALDKEKGGAVDIRLKGADGKVLYTQHLSKNQPGCRVRLNLDDLADGVYQVEVTNGVNTTTQNVTLSTNHPTAPSRIISIQ